MQEKEMLKSFHDNEKKIKNPLMCTQNMVGKGKFNGDAGMEPVKNI